MTVCWVILRGQQFYTVIQAVHSLLYIVAKCHFFSVVTWKDIIKYLQKCEGCTHVREILYISHVSLCSICWVWVSKWRSRRPRRQTAHPVCFLYFINAAKFCCYSVCTQIKVEPLQIRLMYCFYLYDQNWKCFWRYQENIPQNAYPRLSTPEG